MANAADIIARRLHEAGVRHAYGISGGCVLTIIESLDRVGIQFHLSKHENSAGFMAEGNFHATGVPGILIATIGPGMANAANVIANTQQGRVPLIFITGCIDKYDAQSYTHQIIDQAALMEPITKASYTMVDGAVDVIIDKAVSIALDDPMGPVHINLPINLASRIQIDETPIRRGPVFRGGAVGGEIKIAQTWLSQAKKTILISGVDALNQHAEKAIADFVTRFNIPLITSYRTKGILPENHPLCLGAAGLSPKADNLLLPFIAASDLIILAGYDPIEMRYSWYHPWPSDTRVIEFCGVPNTHYMHQSSLSFIGSVAAGLQALAGEGTRKICSDRAIATFRNKLKSAFHVDSGWGPTAIINTARATLPQDCVATVDTGAHRILLSQIWECYAPRTLLQSSGLSTMGCAIPLAVGYKQARPKQSVVVFSGDAGLEMILGELASVRDLCQPILIIVFVDQSLALIELKQRQSSQQSLGVNFSGTDFVGIGKAYNMHAVWVEDTQTLKQEIEDSATRNISTLLACRLPRQSYDNLI